ncbi:MAG: response regulator transcription factor [Geobacteraceae bacterium]|nr:response regulator transcription factor [Geobacteraceae bacterium]
MEYDAKIKILLVDDHKIVRQGLRALIDHESDMITVAEADNGRKAIELLRELSPDVVIMDIAMPEMNGIEATRRIKADFSGIRVIGLSIHDDRRHVLEMLRAGASGYLLKDCAFAELATAVRHAVIGHMYLSPRIAGKLIQECLNSLANSDSSAGAVLTGREREVLQLIAEGKSTQQIADSLFVSVKTVEAHRKQIMTKLDIHNVAGLTRFAIKEGLITLK